MNFSFASILVRLFALFHNRLHPQNWLGLYVYERRESIFAMRGLFSILKELLLNLFPFLTDLNLRDKFLDIYFF